MVSASLVALVTAAEKWLDCITKQARAGDCGMASFMVFLIFWKATAWVDCVCFDLTFNVIKISKSRMESKSALISELSKR